VAASWAAPSRARRFQRRRSSWLFRATLSPLGSSGWLSMAPGAQAPTDSRRETARPEEIWLKFIRIAAYNGSER
jgi:hypothetical protein